MVAVDCRIEITSKHNGSGVPSTKKVFFHNTDMGQLLRFTRLT